MTVPEVLALCFWITREMDSSYSPPIEEIVYDVLGKPRCQIETKYPNYFLNKSFDEISNE